MSDNPLEILKMLTGDSAFFRHNYLAYATGAVTHVDVTGGTNVTLTEIQAAHYQIRLFGTLEANIDVLVPQKEKPYIFVNATTGNFSVTVRPVTSGTGLLLPRGMLNPFTCDGVNVIRYSPGNARTPGGLSHTIESDGVRNLHIHDTYMSAPNGTQTRGRHARGTQVEPAGLENEDRALALSGEGWGRNSTNTAYEWVPLGHIRVGVASVDAQGRLGGHVEIMTNPGVSGIATTRFLFDENGELVLGNPVTGTDKIRLATGDRDGVGGRHSLTIIAEDGTEHLFGDRARLGRLPDGQSLDFRTMTEQTTIAAAAFTDTTILIPSNAVVFGVSVRVQVTIPTAATFSVGVFGAPTRYGSGLDTAATTSHPGTNDATRHYPSSTAIRFTPNVTPANNNGLIRTTIHFYSIIMPTS